MLTLQGSDEPKTILFAAVNLAKNVGLSNNPLDILFSDAQLGWFDCSKHTAQELDSPPNKTPDGKHMVTPSWLTAGQDVFLEHRGTVEKGMMVGSANHQNLLTIVAVAASRLADVTSLSDVYDKSAATFALLLSRCPMFWENYNKLKTSADRIEYLLNVVATNFVEN